MRLSSTSHMDDLKRCATPDPEPIWPDTVRGTSIVVSTRTPSTITHSDIDRSQHPPSSAHLLPPSSAHHSKSVSTMDTDVRASNTDDQSDEILVKIDTVPDTLVKIDTVPDTIVKIDTVPDIIVKTDTVPVSTWDLQDAKCILLMKSDCSIDVKGFRFFTMERLFYALQLITLGDRKFIRQLAKYTRMDYVRKCVNTRFELASSDLQDKWLDEQFQTKHGLRLLLPVFCRTQHSNRHYWIQPAHLCVTPMNQCMRQRLRQQGKCVWNESYSVGLHGSPSPRV